MDGSRQVQGYVLVQSVLQWPHLNTNAETFADVQDEVIEALATNGPD